MMKIVREGSLDDNSPYAYLLAASLFSRTSCVAVTGTSAGEGGDGEVVGFIYGFRPPTAPHALFVWQVGVDGGYRGKKIASHMLNGLFDSLQAEGVTHVQATVGPTNTASQRLFSGFARDRGASLAVQESFYSEADFPPAEPAHEAEDFYDIGPVPQAKE
jgi:L-2,4-diaminobutyric acid acetyltransferase